jgi:hypothetical protein
VKRSDSSEVGFLISLEVWRRDALLHVRSFPEFNNGRSLTYLAFVQHFRACL